MTSLFEQFLKERTYIKNSSPKTLEFYRASMKAYQKTINSATVPTKQDLNAFVSGMREKEIKPVTVNTYIRGMNSFLTWLHENRYLSEHLKIKQLSRCSRRIGLCRCHTWRFYIRTGSGRSKIKVKALQLGGLSLFRPLFL